MSQDEVEDVHNVKGTTQCMKWELLLDSSSGAFSHQSPSSTLCPGNAIPDNDILSHQPPPHPLVPRDWYRRGHNMIRTDRREATQDDATRKADRNELSSSKLAQSLSGCGCSVPIKFYYSLIIFSIFVFADEFYGIRENRFHNDVVEDDQTRDGVWNILSAFAIACTDILFSAVLKALLHTSLSMT